MMYVLFAVRLHGLSIASGASNADCGVKDVAVKAVKPNTCSPRYHDGQKRMVQGQFVPEWVL